MADQWHYASGETKAGPVSLKRLHTLAAAGELQPTDLVWSEGMANWVAAKAIKGLFPKPRASSAPLPLGEKTPVPAEPVDHWRERNLRAYDDAVAQMFRNFEVQGGGQSEKTDRVTLPLMWATQEQMVNLFEQELKSQRLHIPMVGLHSPSYKVNASRTFAGRTPCTIKYVLSVWTLFEEDGSRIAKAIEEHYGSDEKVKLTGPGIGDGSVIVLETTANNLECDEILEKSRPRLFIYRFEFLVELLLPASAGQPPRRQEVLEAEKALTIMLKGFTQIIIDLLHSTRDAVWVKKAKAAKNAAMEIAFRAKEFVDKDEIEIHMATEVIEAVEAGLSSIFDDSDALK